MRAIEVTGTVDEQGNLSLSEPVPGFAQGKVRVIILYSEASEMEHDPDDTPIDDVKASLRRALQEARSGQRIPLSQMWQGIDPE